MDNQELTIIKSENVSTIVHNTPQIYNENVLSRENCNKFGHTLLKKIQEQGMTDALDQEAAVFIDRVRKTLNKMNTKRSPITKLFDDIRKEFTALENDIDPLKKGTVAHQLQQLRNDFAAMRRQKEERIRQEQMRLKQQQLAKEKYCAEVEEDYQRTLNNVLAKQINDLTAVFSSVSLDNYAKSEDTIRQWPCELPADFSPQSNIAQPFGVDGCELLREVILSDLLTKFNEHYQTELTNSRERFLCMMPSKKQELERAAKASAEEAERIRKEIAEREAAEAARKEVERKEREEKERQEMELRRRNTEMNGLFDMAQVSVPTASSKSVVKKKIVPLNSSAFSDILSMWWINEGQYLSVEELSKVCKKQLTFCEKLANDKANPQFIKSEHIAYDDSVKAK